MSKLEDVHKAARQQSDSVSIDVRKISVQASSVHSDGDALIGYFNNDQQDHPERWFSIKTRDVGMLTLINLAQTALAQDQRVSAVLSKRAHDYSWEINVLSVF